MNRASLKKPGTNTLSTLSAFVIKTNKIYGSNHSHVQTFGGCVLIKILRVKPIARPDFWWIDTFASQNAHKQLFTMQRVFPNDAIDAYKHSLSVGVPPLAPQYLSETHTTEIASACPKTVMDIVCVVCAAYGLVYDRESDCIIRVVVYLPDCGCFKVRVHLFSTATGGLLVEVCRVQGPLHMVKQLFRAFEVALQHGHVYTAWHALPEVLHVVPPPFVPLTSGPVVSPLTPEQTQHLLNPVVQLMLHEYSDVVLDGVKCVYSLSDKRANLQTMLNYEPLLRAVLTVLFTGALPDSRVMAALVLCALLAEDAPRVCGALTWTDYAQIMSASGAAPASCCEERYLGVLCTRALDNITL